MQVPLFSCNQLTDLSALNARVVSSKAARARGGGGGADGRTDTTINFRLLRMLTRPAKVVNQLQLQRPRPLLRLTIPLLGTDVPIIYSRRARGQQSTVGLVHSRRSGRTRPTWGGGTTWSGLPSSPCAQNSASGNKKLVRPSFK